MALLSIWHHYLDGGTSPAPEEAMLAQPQLSAGAFSSAADLGAGAVWSQPREGNFSVQWQEHQATWCLAPMAMTQNGLVQQDPQGLTGFSG